jgi:hypothetical protein
MSLDVDAPYFAPATRPSGGAVALALLSEEEFALAQTLIPDFIKYLDYQDWLDYREGFEIGLAMAGIEVKTVNIAIALFQAWCRLSGTPLGVRALDVFASMVLLVRDPPLSAAIGVVSQSEFEAHAGSVEAFASHEDYDHWRRHRDSVRERIGKTGGRIVDLPIRIGDFIEWSRCLGQRTSEASLDIYATLAVEFVTQDAKA